MTPPLEGVYRPKYAYSLSKCLENLGTRGKNLLSNAWKSCHEGLDSGPKGPFGGGGQDPRGDGSEGPWGAFEGGDPPRGGGPGGGGPPPGGVKKGQKVAIQGGPLGLPPRPLQIPYEKWAGWPDFDPPGGGPQGSSGVPPPPGGGFGASRPGLGGGPPPGGAPGGQKGPKKGHFRPKKGGFPQLRVYGKKTPKNVHFIGVLAEFRPKI